MRKDFAGISQTTKFWYNAAGNRVKKQVFNHMAPLENGADTSSVTYYVRDANEAVMAIYQQKVIHTSGMFGCLRKPSNNVGGDSDLDGVVDGGCDNCRPSMLGTLPGAEWNPWQEDYDRDGVGDACDPCPFHFSPPNAPCVGPPLFPEPEVWTGIAVTTTLAELPMYGSERIGLLRPNALRDTSFYLGAIFTRQLDKKEYELKDHLGNVRVVVSDLKGKEGTAIFARVKSVNSYYAFGMLEEGMSGSSGGYRYGYNGKEMDNELKGEGNSVDYGARMYDPRLGRWGSVDMLEYVYSGLSSYNYVANNPISYRDPDGHRICFATEQGEKDFNNAILYLQEHNALHYEKLKQLIDDPNIVIYLHTTDGGIINEFIERQSKEDCHCNTGSTHFNVKSAKWGDIHWNPKSASAYPIPNDVHAGPFFETYSPAIALLHEMIHAWLVFYNPKLERKLFLSASRDHTKPCASCREGFFSPLEQYIVDEFETPAARSIGEIKYGRFRYDNTIKYSVNNPRGTYLNPNGVSVTPMLLTPTPPTPEPQGSGVIEIQPDNSNNTEKKPVSPHQYDQSNSNGLP